ncbi:unnamed protein product, partial [Rotaria sp. Silwood2]
NSLNYDIEAITSITSTPTTSTLAPTSIFKTIKFNDTD